MHRWSLIHSYPKNDTNEYPNIYSDQKYSNIQIFEYIRHTLLQSINLRPQSANHKAPILFLVLPAYHSLRYNYTNSIWTFLKCNVLPGRPTITPCRSSLGIKNRLYSFEQVQSGGEMCCFVVQSLFWATGQKRQIVLVNPLGLCLDKELLGCEMFCSRYHQSMIHHQRLIREFNLGHLGDEIHLPTLSSALRDQVPTLIKDEYSAICPHCAIICSVKTFVQWKTTKKSWLVDGVGC